MELIINTPKEMFELGEKMAKDHKIILLKGDLGAGKTLFTKGFAKGLEIDENSVQSPTYTYLNSYDNKLLHIDMYRLEDENEVWEKGINDQISQYDYITIERPKFIELLDIYEYTVVNIEKKGETRIVRIENQQ
ncbi:MAG TPA: tRNA (adenosine(37)-N6)-threonylcarbamoyltransferase complex ATPase subunit type 1 TsaE [Candidatus Absconditabacterales bacterium]|nr:tRNA (adenosine(37)-N6)-threonylcarbamoyltransferase complex ATPase subunit type 1 TsaE [Candidatus Absconditabacterales bacterium]HPK27974.1 tRNA (adenosine(37)-N6)-threonylcarbamoyltransferase complex ATPase subunit type 1 TsaE [Candidatus Absconditabacterales bacterium]